MNEWTEIKKQIFDLIQSTGIKPIYPMTLIGLFMGYFILKKFKKWEKLPVYEKFYNTVSLSAIILIIIACFVSILYDIGIFNN